MWAGFELALVILLFHALQAQCLACCGHLIIVWLKNKWESLKATQMKEHLLRMDDKKIASENKVIFEVESKSLIIQNLFYITLAISFYLNTTLKQWVSFIKSFYFSPLWSEKTDKVVCVQRCLQTKAYCKLMKTICQNWRNCLTLICPQILSN